MEYYKEMSPVPFLTLTSDLSHDLSYDVICFTEQFHHQIIIKQFQCDLDQVNSWSDKKQHDI